MPDGSPVAAVATPAMYSGNDTRTLRDHRTPEQGYSERLLAAVP